MVAVTAPIGTRVLVTIRPIGALASHSTPQRGPGCDVVVAAKAESHRVAFEQEFQDRLGLLDRQVHASSGVSCGSVKVSQQDLQRKR